MTASETPTITVSGMSLTRDAATLRLNVKYKNVRIDVPIFIPASEYYAIVNTKNAAIAAAEDCESKSLEQNEEVTDDRFNKCTERTTESRTTTQ